MEIEGLIANSFNKPGFGFSTEADRISLVDLESHKRIILLVREQEVRQKSRATWILYVGMTIPLSFISLPIIERILTLSGKLKGMMNF